MPQDIDFDLPAPRSASPDLKRARHHNALWVRRMGLVPEGRSMELYLSWDMPGLAAAGFPHARGEMLELCADAMAFFFVFDDQFDSPLGRNPSRVGVVCEELIGIVHASAPGAGAEACAVAFADVWARCQERAHPGWVARVASEWEYYFAAHPHEAVNRLRGTPSGMESYLHVRRGVAATGLPLSLGERAAGIHVPATAFHSPQLRIMRQAVIDVTIMCNDIYSLEKEQARGDMDNLVLILEHTQSCTRAQALAAACAEIDQRCAAFQDLTTQVPDLCAQLGLDKQKRAAVETYVEVMEAWMSGYHAWQTQTQRYTGAPRTPPATGF